MVYFQKYKVLIIVKMVIFKVSNNKDRIQQGCKKEIHQIEIR